MCCRAAGFGFMPMMGGVVELLSRGIVAFAGHCILLVIIFCLLPMPHTTGLPEKTALVGLEYLHRVSCYQPQHWALWGSAGIIKSKWGEAAFYATRQADHTYHRQRICFSVAKCKGGCCSDNNTT